MSIRPFRNQVLRSRAGGNSQALRAARRARRAHPTPTDTQHNRRQPAASPGPALTERAPAMPLSRIAAARAQLARFTSSVKTTLRSMLQRRVA